MRSNNKLDGLRFVLKASKFFLPITHLSLHYMGSINTAQFYRQLISETLKILWIFLGCQELNPKHPNEAVSAVDGVTGPRW